MEADRLIVSLFDYTGIWSQPYRDAGYEVLQVDIQHGMDIFTTPKPESAHGVILQPPCTDFALSGARWFADKDSDGRTQQSIDNIVPFSFEADFRPCNPLDAITYDK